jgi:selenocysteine lyase/cysteine desulfurase
MATMVDFAELRQREFARLDASGMAYLDYTGAALYPASLVCRDMHRLTGGVFGNPHSESAPSLASTDAISRARDLTLRFLDADRAEYDVVFTSNTSGAVRILAEAFPFGQESRLVLTADNHNSVNGLRLASPNVDYVPLDANLRAEDPEPWLDTPGGPSLFAYPAQSNFSGVRHPLEWVRIAQARGYRVLLDAAAYLPCAPLSLRNTPADFVAFSFYKMFGYPTGVGALVARRDALATLRRRYFAGGTVQFASVQNHVVRLYEGAGAFEDGTPHFLAMSSVCDGLEWLSAHPAQTHIRSLRTRLLDSFESLGDHVTTYGSSDSGTIAFNLTRHGKVLPFEIVEEAARECGIAIRGGCFCNPGAAEHAFGIPAERARACLDRDGFTIPRFRECLGDRPVGALRASLGIANNAADIDRLLEFVDHQTRVH